jgi:predicted PurR-regulated permease PerM
MMVGSLRSVWSNPYARLLVLVVAAVLAYLVLRATQPVWTVVAVAFLMAYLLSPLVAAAERRGLHRVLGVAAAALLFFVLLGGLWALGAAIAAQFSAFAEEVPRLAERLEELPFVAARLVDPAYGTVFQQVYISGQVVADALAQELLPTVGTVGAGGLRRVLTTIANVGMQVTIVLVLSLYLLYRYPAYGESLQRAVPARYRSFVRELAAKADTSVGGYIRGQLLISAVVGVLAGIGLSVIGVPLAVALAVVAAVFNVVPFFGPIVAAVPTAMMALTLGIGETIAALLVLFVVNQVDAHVLTPLIYARTIELDPVTIVIAILLGLALFGLVGALVAVPVAAFAKLLYLDYYLTSPWYDRGRGVEPGT